MAAPWGAIIQAIDHAAGRITGGAGSGIEVAKSQNGGSAANSGNTTDTTLFGKAIQTATNNVKDSLNNNPKIEQVEVEEEENGTEETEGVI